MSAPTDAELATLADVATILGLQGVELGDYEHEPAPLTVDFVYRDASPDPIAIELTSLVHPSELSGADALIDHLREPLDELAVKEGCGCWSLAVDQTALMKPIASVVADLIRKGVEIRPGTYTGDDLRAAELAGQLDEFMALHRELSAIGVIDLGRCIDPHEVVRKHPELAELPNVQQELIEFPRDEVKVMGLAGARPIAGVVRDLLTAVFDNSDKLEAVGDFEKHLVVEVLQWDASRDPRDTPVPPLPDAIDRLWIVHRWAEARDQPHIWWADQGQTVWAVAPTESP